MEELPRIALTMGDPAGIGPELVAKAVNSGFWDGRAELVAYGDPAILTETAKQYCAGRVPEIHPTRILGFRPEMGKVNAQCGLAALDAVTAATSHALGGRVSAMVTAPMNKSAVNLAGVEFSGHTEYIAEICGVPDSEVVMMQSAGAFRVAFVTTHVAISEVAKHVTPPRIARVVELLSEAVLWDTGGAIIPRIAVAALNPHAGENGFMGREDEEIVKVTIERLKREGYLLTGPFPPDTLFIPGTPEKFDGIVAMYHDQGHIPFKMLAFNRGVNSTLGLPIIRTSPDHGTAFEIAGRGVADTGSFFAAIELACRRCTNKPAE